MGKSKSHNEGQYCLEVMKNPHDSQGSLS